MDKQTFINGMTLLQTHYGEIEESLYKSHAWALKDIPNADFIRGIKNTIDNYQYNSFPKSSDIRRFCGFDIESKAQLAIGELKRVANKSGSFDSVSFGDPVLHLVSETSDKWASICHWDEKQWSFNYKKMVDMYKSMYMAGRGVDHIRGYGERTKSIYEVKKHSLPWSDFAQIDHKPEDINKIGINNIIKEEF